MTPHELRRIATPAFIEARAALQMIGVEPGVLDDHAVCDTIARRLCTFLEELKRDEKRCTRGHAESFIIALAAEAGVPTTVSPLGQGIALDDRRLADLLEGCLAQFFDDPRR
ncbi:MAG TPA: hypothetical protein VEB19_18840 [Gemmatimonadaceae bacterium]|nr:hypothetical protein [Gemmatimonadaceae bacterium]